MKMSVLQGFRERLRIEVSSRVKARGLRHIQHSGRRFGIVVGATVL